MPGILAAIFGFILLALGLLGGLVVAIMRIIRGPGGQEAAQADEEEARLIQEMHKSLQRMEQRIDALETILLEKDSKESRHENI